MEKSGGGSKILTSLLMRSSFLAIQTVWNDASPQRRKERKGCAEASTQISAQPLRPLRLCGEAPFQRQAGSGSK